MDEKDGELSMALYKSSNFIGGCLGMRLFYVRIAPCSVDSVPDHLTLRHIRTEIGVSLEINGHRLLANDTATINLRRDRVDRDLSEVTYVSTDSVTVSGAVEFEVRGGDDDELVLCGSLERLDGLDSDSKSGWSMDSYPAAALASGGSRLFQRMSGVCSPSIEVYIAGCCSGMPVILTKMIQVSPRRKVSRHKMLDAIPEDEELGKEQRPVNELILQRKMQGVEVDTDDYESNTKIGNSVYTDDIMYIEEEDQLSWFNAGVRVGVGIGLGMCLGVGIGVGLLMRSYQATTRNFRRRFF